MDSKTWIEIFKLAPAIVALLCVIYLMYKIIMKKDETIKDLVKLSEADIARQAKIITLLEILVTKGREA
jgi:succinate dehydrogenase hydrophobic anchor subunit